MRKNKITSDSDPVCIATYSSEMSAVVAKTALDASGIYSFISSDDCGGLRPHLQISTGVRLMIRKSDTETAGEILSHVQVISETDLTD